MYDENRNSGEESPNLLLYRSSTENLLLYRSFACLPNQGCLVHSCLQLTQDGKLSCLLLMDFYTSLVDSGARFGVSDSQRWSS